MHGADALHHNDSWKFPRLNYSCFVYWIIPVRAKGNQYLHVLFFKCMLMFSDLFTKIVFSYNWSAHKIVLPECRKSRNPHIRIRGLYSYLY